MIDIVYSTLIDVSSKLTQTNVIEINGSELNCVLAKLRDLGLANSDAYRKLNQYHGLDETNQLYRKMILTSVDMDKKHIFEKPAHMQDGVDYQFYVNNDGHVTLLTNRVLQQILDSVNVTTVI